MTQRHTPGELFLAGGLIVATDGTVVCEVNGPNLIERYEEKQANRERLARCWNVCLKMPDPVSDVPTLIKALGDLKRRVESFLPPVDCGPELRAARQILERIGA